MQDAASIEIVFFSLVRAKLLDKTLHGLDLLRSNLFRDRLIEFVILDVEKLVQKFRDRFLIDVIEKAIYNV